MSSDWLGVAPMLILLTQIVYFDENSSRSDDITRNNLCPIIRIFISQTAEKMETEVMTYPLLEK